MLSKNVQKYKVSVAQVVCVQYLLGPGQLPRSTTGPSPFSDDVSAQASSSSQVFQHAVSHHLFFFLSPLVYFRFPPLTMPVDPDHSVNIVASDPEIQSRSKMKLLFPVFLLFAVIALFTTCQACTTTPLFAAGSIGTGGCPRSCFATCQAVNYASTTTCAYTHIVLFGSSTSTTKTCAECYPFLGRK